MTEPKSGTPEIEAILANDEFIKKLAAKILDAIQPQPQGTGTHCSQYSMPLDEQAKERKTLWANKLTALGMELETGLPESAADEYLLSADELDQVVTEIKTSDAYTEKLSGADLSKAVGKVLADNEMMRRKGSLKAGAANTSGTPAASPALCAPPAHSFIPCIPCAPSQAGNPWIPGDCFVPCSPYRSSQIPGVPNGHLDCMPCSHNQVGTAWSHSICVPCSPSNNQPATHNNICWLCGPSNSHPSFTCSICSPQNSFVSGASNICSSSGPYNIDICSSSGPYNEWKFKFPTSPQEIFESARSMQPPAPSPAPTPAPYPAPAPTPYPAPAPDYYACTPFSPNSYPSCIPCAPNSNQFGSQGLIPCPTCGPWQGGPVFGPDHCIPGINHGLVCNFSRIPTWDWRQPVRN
jgi:hypothetical protein